MNSEFWKFIIYLKNILYLKLNSYLMFFVLLKQYFVMRIYKFNYSFNNFK